jgi:mRNA interferase MazF
MVSSYIPDYGDIVWLVLEPRVGHEQSGRRPAIVISERRLSEHTSLAVMCPITSRIKGLPFEIELEKTETKGAALPIHVKSIDWSARKAKFIEKAPRTITDKVAESVGAIIGLEN